MAHKLAGLFLKPAELLDNDWQINGKKITKKKLKEGLDLSSDENLLASITDISKAIKIEPTYALFWESRADMYEEMKEYDKAASDRKKALELNPDKDADQFNGTNLFCDNCGARLESGAAFCEDCGAPNVSYLE